MSRIDDVNGLIVDRETRRIARESEKPRPVKEWAYGSSDPLKFPYYAINTRDGAELVPFPRTAHERG